jgi:hypothetical protein
MKSTILILVFTMLCQGAVVSVCSTGCTTTSLQTAFDSLAACGDTIQIKSSETQTGNFTITYRGCTSGTPITVTSDRAATWLPNANARVTPSQLGNMAQIVTPNSLAAVAGILDGSNRPPAHWKFVGISFSNSSTAGTFQLVSFNSQNSSSSVCLSATPETDGCALNSSEVADDITFDRDYFWMSSTVVNAAPAIQDVIRADATNVTVKNCFLGDGFFNGFVESHGVRVLTSAGPITVSNTFIVTSGAPIFSGGSTPSYPAYLANGVTAKYNYFWRPWKWNFDPAQPFAADYVAAAQNTLRTGPWTLTNVSNTGLITVPATPPFIAASLLTITGVTGCTVANGVNWRMTQVSGTTFQLLNFPGCNAAYTGGGSINEYAITVCTKNLGEFKWGTGIDWEYNAGENSWQANQCMSQYTGVTDTVRSETDQLGLIGSFVDTTHITWAGSYRIGNVSTGARTDLVGDLVACMSITTTGMECHPISSFSGASAVLSTPFSAAPAGTFGLWINYTGGAQLENMTVAHNIWKNVDNPYSVLAMSYATANCNFGGPGCGQNHTVSNNLAFANTSYIRGDKAVNIGAAEEDYAIGPSGYSFSHNTFYYPSGMGNSFFYVDGLTCPLCATTHQVPFTDSSVTNNLFGVSSAGGNGPFSGDSVSNVIDTANLYFLFGHIANNAIPGGTNGTNAITRGTTVSGNQYQPWVNPFVPGTYTVASSSMYYNAGTDGKSLGADFTTLPMINNIAVVGNILAFDLTSGVNSDAKNTQPCVLEVSSSRNLQSDLGTYSVIASLDPTLTIGADLSTRSDVTLSGAHVTWPLTGITPGTTYYGRLQCYGDTEWFTTTGSTGVGATVSVTITGKSAIGGKVAIP